MAVKTTRLLGRLMSIALLWTGFVSATNGIENLPFSVTQTDGFSKTIQIRPHRDEAQTRSLLVAPQIRIVKGRYHNTVLSYSSLQLAFFLSNIAWSSVRCDLWGSTNSRASLSEMRLVRSWNFCRSPLNIHSFPYDGSYYFRVVGIPAYSSRNVLAASQWIIDREAPRTTMLLSSSRCGTTSCVRFSFFALDTNGISKYECRENYGDWLGCKSPYRMKVRGKSNSKHTFQVRAIDQAGNVDPTPAGYSWTLGADWSTTETPSSNAVPSSYSADSPDEDDSGSSSGSFPMLVVYIAVPIVGVVILAGLVVLSQRALLKRRLSRAQAYP